MTDRPVIMTGLSVIKIGDTGIYRRSPIVRGIYKFLFMTFLSLKKGTIVVEFGIRGFSEMASDGLCVIIRGCSPRTAGTRFGGAGVRGGLRFYQAGNLPGIFISGGKRGPAFYVQPLPAYPAGGGG
jgi:hypothetical protein